MELKVLMVFATTVILHVHIIFTLSGRKADTSGSKAILIGMSTLWYAIAFSFMAQVSGVDLLMWCIPGGVLATAMAVLGGKSSTIG
ncbi:hypothetical protein Mmc1_3237 [Magnetococcus marinus MC-1]|uniref:Uncharacterized protein n=1 Tax=Magnetococcus marinus (strain ATCC BAA-1437 / JCM 17883 / MC-1) TaxID=156889 RepID=A0LCN4_MAGMM|nr:hypothetical protein [Magnetococcus marinus]ABK45727.1 hypothetical protein Mmc1_3237 [Magnetococcus marinus MC-1]